MTARRIAIRAGMMLAAVVAVVAIGAGKVVAPAPGATTTCTKVASPTGSDTAAGTLAAPYKTVTKLVASLQSGNIGCLRSGAYTEDVTITHAGITLTAYGTDQATLIGRLWLKQGADGTVISGLHLVGVNGADLPSPTVNANDVQFVGNFVTNSHTEICFLIGSAGWGRAERTIIKGNRIHDCGQRQSTNMDHGIYVSEADGTQILDNVIYRNTDRGIQLYPDAQGTIIRGNVIDGNGEGIIFSGDTATASSNTVVQGNAITNSKLRHDVESFWEPGGPVGTGNSVSGNCIDGGAQGEIGPQTGFTASSNTLADPGYLNLAADDFRVASSSPCATILAKSLAPAGPNGEPPVAKAPWTPIQGARVQITKAGSPGFGLLGEIAYLSQDHKRALLLMDNITPRAVLVSDIGPVS